MNPAALLITVAPAVLGYTLTLAWTPAPGAVGSKLYWGPSSGDYTNAIDVGPASRCTLSNLVSGATYYLAATDYDGAGTESLFSNEVTWTIRPPRPALLLGNALVEVPVNFSCSTNCRDWAPAGAGVAWALFPMTNAAGFIRAEPQRARISRAP